MGRWRKVINHLERPPKLFGYALDDFNGVSPSVVMHRIPIMEDVDPIVDTQKHVHPQMKDVVKKKR
jgi:hypothetical protein